MTAQAIPPAFGKIPTATAARAGRGHEAGSTRLAFATVVFAALALGFSAIFVRFAGVPGAASALYRMLIAAVVMAPAALHQARRGAPVASRNVRFAVLAGVLFAADLTCWNTGVLVGSATNATLLANTAPVWVAVGSVLLLGARLRPAFWAGLGLAMVGVAGVLGGDLVGVEGFARGDLLGLAAGFFYGAFFLPSQRARQGLSVLVAWWIAAVTSSVVLLGVTLLLGQPLTGYSLTSWGWLVAVALVTQVGGYLAINFALGRLPAPLVSSALLLQPVITALLAVPLLGERLTWPQAASGVLVLVGIAAVRRASSAAPG